MLNGTCFTGFPSPSKPCPKGMFVRTPDLRFRQQRVSRHKGVSHARPLSLTGRLMPLPHIPSLPTQTARCGLHQAACMHVRMHTGAHTHRDRESGVRGSSHAAMLSSSFTAAMQVPWLVSEPAELFLSVPGQREATTGVFQKARLQSHCLFHLQVLLETLKWLPVWRRRWGISA